MEPSRINSTAPPRPITLIVLGNPPYRERAKALGGLVVDVDKTTKHRLLDDFLTPETRRSAYALHNLYVYFWRLAILKAFETRPANARAAVAFITPSAYLASPMFAGMRAHLRRVADQGWILALSDGFQPPVNTRIFHDVQQPLCIGMFVRSEQATPETPGAVRYQALNGTRAEKIAALAAATDNPAAAATAQKGAA